MANGLLKQIYTWCKDIEMARFEFTLQCVAVLTNNYIDSFHATGLFQ